MKQRCVAIVLGFFLFLMTSPLLAGQVITDSDRKWAKQAVEQEKSLEAAAAPNTVAVLAFHNASRNTALDPLQKGFAFLLMTDLAQVNGITVVERVRLQALLEELNLGASGLVEQGTAPRVGKLAGASHLVGGDLTGGAQDRLGVASDVVQVKDQKSLGRPSADGMLGQVFELEKKILLEIVDLLRIKLSRQQRDTLKKPLTTSYQAFAYLSYALDASDRGNYERAELFYRRALDEDPHFVPAQKALNELAALRLVTASPRSDAILVRQEEQNSSTTTLTRNTATFREFRPITSGQIRVNW